MIRGLLFFLWLTAAAAQEKYPITIEAPKDEGGATLWARNDGPAPVSIVLRLTASENIQADAALPLALVVPPRSRERVMRIAQVERKKGWRYAYSWSWRLGAYTARHDAKAVYRVPWMDGQTFRIDQAPGGPITTHTTPSSREAVDITMPEGTPIVAAREGRVIRVAQGFSEGGPNEALRNQANVVEVLHEDDTLGQYVHFRNRGVTVREGETVAAGTLLGYAGSTGYSTGPHLHFAVLRLVREGESLDYVSVPFTFYAGRPARMFTPVSGMAVRADYQSLQKH